MNIKGKDSLSLRYYDPTRAFNGYTLFSEMGNNNVWLIDMKGRIVHRWKMSSYDRGCYGVLLPNGNLLYAGKTGREPLPEFGGSYGIIMEVDWNGKVVWKYEDEYMSHDFFRMNNGNTMVLRWVRTPDDIAAKVKGGVSGSEREGVMWSDELHEINPQGEVVWEWKSYEHFDLDKDVIGPVNLRDRWGQANAVHVMPNGSILLSFPYMDLIEIVDKNSGNIIWRWGGTGELGFQHNPTVLDNGNILLFDNGRYRPQAPDYSRVIEINPQTDKVEWEYMGEPPHSFYASFMGGAQRLPNANTLICESAHGRFFETTPKGEIVWEYVNPFYYETARSGEATRFGKTNMTFRAYRYSPDYPGLKGTGLDDMNVIYGPDGFASSPVGPANSEAAAASSTGDYDKMPSVGKKDPEHGEGKTRVQSRIEQTGY
ncbi:MAG: aryl-sulfate sulfotransferase [Deltaproteobacteria bacterium]|nr:aryl-sulfate sulfotransferase [Deltaproteobacteria bacterium]